MGKKRKHFHKSKFQSTIPKGLPENTQKELESLFDQTFSYETPSDVQWLLPTAIETFNDKPWVEKTLALAKTTLNSVKDELSDVDVLIWHNHTQSTHKAGKVMHVLRQGYDVELCTQAWCKFHEIICRFQLVAEGNEDFVSVHLCEAPGAFITSLNHYIKSRYPFVRFHWIANTLNPYYEGNDPQIMIDDAVLIRDTLPRWFFGKDNTGDITSKINLIGLTDITKSMKVNLVTADGSINCQNSPSEQERILAYLQFCETVGALSILKSGGHFVIKMFTMFEAESISLMYLLNCVFDEVHIMKPATSKPGNSELYVICKEFRGISESNLSRLHDMCENEETFRQCPLFSRSQIPDCFMEQHVAACEKFKKLQIDTIEKNLETFGKLSIADREDLEVQRNFCTQLYLDWCRIQRIPVQDRVIPQQSQGYKKICKNVCMVQYQRKRLQGSYNERQVLKNMPWRDRVRRMKAYPKEDYSPIWLQNQPLTPYIQGKLSSFRPLTGLPVKKILCSRVCHQQLLEEYTDLLEHSELVKSSDPQDILYSNKDLSEICGKVLDALELKENTATACKVIGNEGETTPFLEGMKETAKKRQDGTSGSEITCLWIADITSQACPFHLGEVQTKVELLSSAIEALQSLQPGESFVCHIFTALTRYTVGLVYLLTYCFSKVTLHDFCDTNISPSFYLLCKEFISCPVELLKCLLAVSEEQKRNDVQQFIPADFFHESVFKASICNINDSIVMKRINALLSRESEYISSNSSVK